MGISDAGEMLEPRALRPMSMKFAKAKEKYYSSVLRVLIS